MAHVLCCIYLCLLVSVCKLPLEYAYYILLYAHDIFFTQVNADSGKTFTFSIRPTKLGSIKLNVKAQTSSAADAVERFLLVKVLDCNRELREEGHLGKNVIEGHKC